jgi:hypothetical protein
MPQILEVKREVLVELSVFVAGRDVLQGRGDEMLGDFERGLDLDARGGSRIEDRDGAGEKGGKEVDRPNRNEELRPDRPLIPKLLQHAALQSHRHWPQAGLPRSCGPTAWLPRDSSRSPTWEK